MTDNENEIINSKRELLTTTIEATVVEVGDEDKGDNYSYKYKFINPLTNETCEDYDIIETVDIGERIYDVGDEIQLIFTERLPHPGETKNYTIMRTPEYPLERKKFKRKKRILTIIWVLFLLSISCLCSFGSLLNQIEQNNTQVENSTEQTSSSSNN